MEDETIGYNEKYYRLNPSSSRPLFVKYRPATSPDPLQPKIVALFGCYCPFFTIDVECF